MLIFCDRRGGFQISTQNKVKIVKVDFFLDGSNWDADCQEVGLVGYADPDLNRVRENVFDAIRFFLSNEGIHEVEFEERITTLEE